LLEAVCSVKYVDSYLVLSLRFIWRGRHGLSVSRREGVLGFLDA
jgi:hypothetical protein